MCTDPRVEVLAANELQLLADLSMDLATKYERNAALIEDEDVRRLTLALSKWRRERARYFREMSAAAECVEAPHLEWERARL